MDPKPTERSGRAGPAPGPSWRLGLSWRQLCLAAGATALYSAILFAVGVVAGDWASDMQLKAKVVAWLQSAGSGSRPSGPDEQIAPWRPVPTALLDLEMAIVQVAPWRTNGRGGALEEVGDAILFVSPLGEFGYLSSSLEMKPLDLRVDLGWDRLEESGVAAQGGFVALMFRVLDLLAVERTDGAYDLYVSHHRFGDGCFEVVVSRTTLLVEADGLRPLDGEWEALFVAKPCLPPKQRGFVFEGNETGGRMALLDDRTLLLTLGDAQFNGVAAEEMFAQDPNADFGKILRIDRETGASRVYSSGHRNPQGLLIARSGAIWSTEHGEEGGDELNLIRDGANYGWPLVTYGLEYSFGGPRRYWPLNSSPGRHDGYEEPVYVLVPSLGVSNVVEPDVREFPLWRDHLIIGTMYSGGQLLVVRIVDGDRVAYAEPVPFNWIVRDMVTLRDGRIAILTDGGQLIFLRNTDRPSDESGDVEDTLTVAMAPELYTTAAVAGAARPALTRGEDVFLARCLGCHSLTGAVGVGPPLDGLLGRSVGAIEGYGYSPALAAADGSWTASRLRGFLADPNREVAGTSMPAPGLPPDDVAAVVRYLQDQ